MKTIWRWRKPRGVRAPGAGQGGRYLLQGTILTDVDETVAGIEGQHNVFEQLGIDPEEAFGYRILEPLVALRNDGVRKVGRALGLPAELFEGVPFPEPALAARVLGEATAGRVETRAPGDRHGRGALGGQPERLQPLVHPGALRHPGGDGARDPVRASGDGERHLHHRLQARPTIEAV